ncbi:uncharacterized protein Dvir_GJ25647 [Drosophila virilis]|uniref:Uncharacterized protein n=1 Tax=Drosophila virilis TaxID=7244 RepID=A0A0Q9VY03_DROVI|nr:uncharacterized protein Dvir_GJ25647 [Drosophila virilis]
MNRPEVAPALTQFDSLSSELEETSSNPDSGNASLADFPLAAHANTSIELQTSYNSRFEVKEHYVTEVSISTDDDTVTVCESAKQEAEDFPRLPTEEELLESLREEAALNETELISQEKLDETPALKQQLKQAVYDLTSESLIKELNDSSFEGNEVDENNLVSIAQDELQEQRESMRQEAALNGTEIASELNSEQKLDETLALSMAVYDLTSEPFLKEINDISFDENEADENDFVGIGLDEAFLKEITIDESALNEPAACELVQRKKSIVYETPQINLSISEVRLNYDTKAEQEESETSSEDRKKDGEAEEEGADMPIKDTLTRNERHSSGCDGNSDGDGEANEIETRHRQGLPALAEERPTTSSKALSVFGEVRPATAAGAGAELRGATQGGLTTLEHVLVACTVGLITPNDLLTLCLIVIGVIIIVAIALA